MVCSSLVSAGPSSRFIDIAVNLTDDMFQGNYRGKQLHRADVEDVIARAKGKGVDRQIITGTSLVESRGALDLARKHGLHATAGCHPTSTSEIDKHPGGADAYFAELEAVIQDAKSHGDGRLVAVGEIGLDYDRLHHAPRETQLAHLPRLLDLGWTHRLPMFLHSRHPEAHVDFVTAWRAAVARHAGAAVEGVVHSFTGTAAEMNELVDLGLYIGINGCSLKTQENLDVVKEVPLERIMLETDAPWCSITSTSAASAHLPPADHPLAPIQRAKAFKEDPACGIKGRNEPADIGSVAHVVAHVKGIPVEEVAAAAWRNTLRVFFPHDG